ncbi:hypothetical protein MYX84_03225 [Acidobacteria bacterium AH-259-O06]|nr:hypothetical protein [Acidobacteria bacterium AH-259-O06]
MRKQLLVILAIAALFFASSADLWAQGKGKGRGGQKSTVGRQKAGRNQRAQRRAPDRNRKREKKSLSRANLKSGAFGKLQSITAMDSRQLQSLYESSVLEILASLPRRLWSQKSWGWIETRSFKGCMTKAWVKS